AAAPAPRAADTSSQAGWSSPPVAPKPVPASEASWPSTSPAATPRATGPTRALIPAMRPATVARHLIQLPGRQLIHEPHARPARDDMSCEPVAVDSIGVGG